MNYKSGDKVIFYRVDNDGSGVVDYRANHFGIVTLVENEAINNSYLGGEERWTVKEKRLKGYIVRGTEIKPLTKLHKILQ